MTQETLNLDNFRQIIATPLQPTDGGAISLSNVTLDQRVILATTNPFKTQDVASIIVPPGYGLCFSSASNNGWTDNKDIGSNPGLEGYDYANESEYLKQAKRAQLVAVDPQNGSWVGYEPELDRSRGGTKYWPNTDSFAWDLKWYMNDRDNGYGDNAGTANVEFLIFLI
jgi:hypothetical protein